MAILRTHFVIINELLKMRENLRINEYEKILLPTMAVINTGFGA
jgi:hypothetical protein